MTTAQPAPTLGRITALSLPRAQAVVGTVVVALTVNLVLWLIGLAAGGDFMVSDGDERISAAPVGVVVMTVIPLAVGMTAAALISLRWLPVLRIAQVVGAVLPLATIFMTVTSDFDGQSMTALALMHVVIAIVAVIGLQTIRNHASVARTAG